ncbi:DNA topoisomerase IB [Actinophytocola oryzae]|uniref:DNA topoisomerase n=1 Tax=Actinophytocola oryzae TaxID=502181 RepID=A0A4R7VQJ0_9PSEU|nr:DNA topoisomerase IB [Actinophytocola oryzae]TDV51892.1 DNA topoisomerase IB [Actinophytocola oryzae]
MRLRRSNVWGKGIGRRGSGKGFRYVDHLDAPVRDAGTVDRIRALAIPPAWRDVWISPHPNGHIQAVGTDDAGRRQYLYHDEWRRVKDEEKHRRVVTLARRLPELRAAVAEDLSASGLGRARVLAGALRMLDRGVFRTGGEEYAQEGPNGPGTRGVATLLRGDVTVRGGQILFHYLAKGGIDRRVRIRDGALAALVTALRRGRADDERLLAYRVGGERREVHAEDVNERLREIVGEDFSAKDLRTWHATVLAAVALAGVDTPSSERGRRRAEKAVMTEVAEQLGNTPAVARRSYVDPRVLSAWERGETIAASDIPVDPSALADDENRASIEKAVIRLLD